MYSEFEPALAIALGDEFDENNINAYQLADFADTCQLSRYFVARRLKYIIRKLLVALQEISIMSVDGKGESYLTKYQETVTKRCKHLLEQSDEIISIQL